MKASSDSTSSGHALAERGRVQVGRLLRAGRAVRGATDGAASQPTRRPGASSLDTVPRVTARLREAADRRAAAIPGSAARRRDRPRRSRTRSGRPARPGAAGDRGPAWRRRGSGSWPRRSTGGAGARRRGAPPAGRCAGRPGRPGSGRGAGRCRPAPGGRRRTTAPRRRRASPGSTRARARRSRPCCDPVVMSTSSARHSPPLACVGLGHPLPQGGDPLGRAVLDGLRPVAPGAGQHRVGGQAQPLDREALRRRQPTGHRQHVGPGGQVQQVADDRRRDACDRAGTAGPPARAQAVCGAGTAIAPAFTPETRPGKRDPDGAAGGSRRALVACRDASGPVREPRLCRRVRSRGAAAGRR